MPIYMDRHNVPGITAKAAAEAHREDIKIQDEYGCRAITYWVDEERGNAFCLVDAPDKETVQKMHDRAHGLIPYEIVQVNSNVVEAFLGRITDPKVDVRSEDNLKIFNDPAFRTILVTRAMDIVLLIHEIGQDKTAELLTLKNDIIREKLTSYEGREVDLDGQGFIISFLSVNQAVECALAIQKALHVAAELIRLRIGLHAGVPVNEHDILFGKTINVARFICTLTKAGQVGLSSVVYDLHKKSTLPISTDKVKWLNKAEELFIEQIVHELNDHWQDAQFNVETLCKELSISKSNLYRKCVHITGKSPNTLLREYRLQQALLLMQRSGRNVAQITFDCGFNSPSYFTKCFQKRFGIQPMAYMKAIA